MKTQAEERFLKRRKRVSSLPLAVLCLGYCFIPAVGASMFLNASTRGVCPNIALFPQLVSLSCLLLSFHLFSFIQTHKLKAIPVHRVPVSCFFTRLLSGFVFIFLPNVFISLFAQNNFFVISLDHFLITTST